MDRTQVVHEAFLARIKDGNLPARRGTTGLGDAGMPATLLAEIYTSQVLSRQLDRLSRKLQARGQGFYTIGSSGHEGNAAIAAALRPTDMAFLHYRDAAFQIQRSRQVPGQSPLWDMVLSFAASSEDPISGGRHKVLGSKALSIPPQTSTIASHLPKAVGAAYSIGLAERLEPEHRALPTDGIVMASFGDASLNHASAQAALNTASWTAYQGSPLPILFVCEDNGIGISTKTPAGWVAASVGSRPALHYVTCDGLDVIDTYVAARDLTTRVRDLRRPGFLHLSCVRLYGHAGADTPTAYLTKAEVEADEALDPLMQTVRIMADEGVMSPAEALEIYEETGARAERVAEIAVDRPKLRTATDVVASLVPPPRNCASTNGPAPEARKAAFGETDLRAMEQPQHMAKLINMALTDLMLEHREIVLAGEDVGRKGGVYGVTQRLQERFGRARVIDTLLDEQSILGLAIGLAHNGLVPIPEIQFLAYLHNAEDQLRGEAATLSFFSNGQYTNPMVVRIAGLGYQRGFGGHFHNDNSLAVLRDIPGLIVACPSNGRDAALMLRECVRLAREEQRVVMFVEPIALYMTRDLHEPKDGLWTFDYPGAGDRIEVGQIGVHGEGNDLAIVSYGNGAFLARQAAKVLAEANGIEARVIDLRWLAPLPEERLLNAVKDCASVLIVDECRRTGSQSEALMTMLTERSMATALSRVAAEDCFIATGPAYAAPLPSRDQIIAEAVTLVGERHEQRAAG